MKMQQIAINSKVVREYWNNKAKSLQDFSQAPSTLFYREREIELLKKWLPRLVGKKFLSLDLWDEVHNTRILSWVYGQKGVPYGIDISDYQVQQVQQKFAKTGLGSNHFRVSDVRDIKFSDNVFDVVYGLGTIEHMPDYGKAVCEIYRILKHGGLAVIGVPSKHDPFLRPLMVTLMTWFDKYPYAPEKAFWWGEFKNLFWAAGFEIVEETGFVFMPGWLRMLDLYFELHAKPLTKITKLLLQPFFEWERKSGWARRHGYIMALVVRKK